MENQPEEVGEQSPLHQETGSISNQSRGEILVTSEVKTIQVTGSSRYESKMNHTSESEKSIVNIHEEELDSDESIGSLVCSTLEYFDIQKAMLPSRHDRNLDSVAQYKKILMPKDGEFLVNKKSKYIEIMNTLKEHNIHNPLANSKDIYNIQANILHSIQALNFSLFFDLGGSGQTDINFADFNPESGFASYPLFFAAAKGSL